MSRRTPACSPRPSAAADAGVGQTRHDVGQDGSGHRMISRRSFLISCTAILHAPHAARAQQADRVRRIGVLMHYAEDDPESKAQLAAFRKGLQQLGWSEDRNIRIDIRFAADKPDQFQMLARDSSPCNRMPSSPIRRQSQLRCSARVTLSRSCSRKSLIRSVRDSSRT